MTSPRPNADSNAPTPMPWYAVMGWTVFSFVILGFAFPHAGSIWSPQMQKSLCAAFSFLPQPILGLLAHVALAPLIYAAMRARSSWRVIWITYPIALVWWLYMIRWLMLVTVGGTIGACCVMALYTPAVLVVLRAWRARFNIPMTIGFPMVWVVFEMLRGFAPAGGFGWFALGDSQAPYDPAQTVSAIAQTADLFGVFGVSFLLAMTNGLLADLWLFRTGGNPANEASKDATAKVSPETKPPVKEAPSEDAPSKESPAKEASGSAPGLDSMPGRLNRLRMASMVGLWVLCLVGAEWYGNMRLNQVGTPSLAPWDYLNVAVVQTNVPVSNDRFDTPEEEQEHWEKLVELTRQAGALHPDVIAWPETMSPAPLNPEAMVYSKEHCRGYEQYDQMIKDMSNEFSGTTLLVGASANIDYQPFTLTLHGKTRTILFPTQRFNSVFQYLDGKQSPARYDKIHRVPFGEYIPWVDGWPWLKGIFITYFSPYPFDYSVKPGQTPTVFELQMSQHLAIPPGQAATKPAERPDAVWNVMPAINTRIITPICFEDAVPRAVRRMAYDEKSEKRADIMVNVTNDGWYPGTDQNVQHFQIAAMRCIENRIPMARSVNTGVSGFITSSGQIISMVEKDGKRQEIAGIGMEALYKDHRVSPFGWWSFYPTIGLTAVSILITLASWWPKRKK